MGFPQELRLGEAELPRTTKGFLRRRAGKECPVRVSFLLDLVSDGDICQGPFWRATFSWESCEEMDSEQESHEDWVLETG